MLAVREEHRGKGIATKLVRMAIDAMIERDAEEVRSTSSTLALSPISFHTQPAPPPPLLPPTPTNPPSNPYLTQNILLMLMLLV